MKSAGECQSHSAPPFVCPPKRHCHGRSLIGLLYWQRKSYLCMKLHIFTIDLSIVKHCKLLSSLFPPLADWIAYQSVSVWLCDDWLAGWLADWWPGNRHVLLSIPILSVIVGWHASVTCELDNPLHCLSLSPQTALYVDLWYKWP